MTKSDLEEHLLFQMTAVGLPEPKREWRFAAWAVGGPGRGVRERLRDAGLRDWRFDFAYPEQKVAAECEGGAYSRGRHTRGSGFESDCEKYTKAALLGWTVVRGTRRHIDSGEMVAWIEEALDDTA